MKHLNRIFSVIAQGGMSANKENKLLRAALESAVDMITEQQERDICADLLRTDRLDYREWQMWCEVDRSRAKQRNQEHVA